MPFLEMIGAARSSPSLCDDILLLLLTEWLDTADLVIEIPKYTINLAKEGKH